ncbi:hypothetical protein CRE_12127 [Caenorhabditis remanei]|uniref:Peptidase A2 domain-containing protein n=1 Tax=Caenorhabditis remanei TaxID=31234 RepID=E3MQ08_CAERE|nr:hypothetical protein CRE_12127 [Caenorhabditis remanei]
MSSVTSRSRHSSVSTEMSYRGDENNSKSPRRSMSVNSAKEVLRDTNAQSINAGPSAITNGSGRALSFPQIFEPRPDAAPIVHQTFGDRLSGAVLSNVPASAVRNPAIPSEARISCPICSGGHDDYACESPLRSRYCAKNDLCFLCTSESHKTQECPLNYLEISKNVAKVSLKPGATIGDKIKCSGNPSSESTEQTQSVVDSEKDYRYLSYHDLVTVLPQFNADPIKYGKFARCFDRLVMTNPRLDDLLKFSLVETKLVGKAKRFIVDLMDPRAALEATFKALRDEFEKDNYSVVNEIRARFENLTFHETDYKRATLELQDCKSLILQLEELKEDVSSASFVRELARKLPRKAFKRLRPLNANGQTPTTEQVIGTFSEFLKENRFYERFCPWVQEDSSKIHEESVMIMIEGSTIPPPRKSGKKRNSKSFSRGAGFNTDATEMPEHSNRKTTGKGKKNSSGAKNQKPLVSSVAGAETKRQEFSNHGRIVTAPPTPSNRLGRQLAHSSKARLESEYPRSNNQNRVSEAHLKSETSLIPLDSVKTVSNRVLDDPLSHRARSKLLPQTLVNECCEASGVKVEEDFSHLPFLALRTTKGKVVLALVDTGASCSFLSQNCAKRLGLSPIGYRTAVIKGVSTTTTERMSMYRLSFATTGNPVEFFVSGRSRFPETKFFRPRFGATDNDFLRERYIDPKVITKDRASNGRALEMIIGNDMLARILGNSIRALLPSGRYVEFTPFGSIIFPAPRVIQFNPLIVPTATSRFHPANSISLVDPNPGNIDRAPSSPQVQSGSTNNNDGSIAVRRSRQIANLDLSLISKNHHGIRGRNFVSQQGNCNTIGLGNPRHGTVNRQFKGEKPRMLKCTEEIFLLDASDGSSTIRYMEPRKTQEKDMMKCSLMEEHRVTTEFQRVSVGNRVFECILKEFKMCTHPEVMSHERSFDYFDSLAVYPRDNNLVLEQVELSKDYRGFHPQYYNGKRSLLSENQFQAGISDRKEVIQKVHRVREMLDNGRTHVVKYQCWDAGRSGASLVRDLTASPAPDACRPGTSEEGVLRKLTSMDACRSCAPKGRKFITTDNSGQTSDKYAASSDPPGRRVGLKSYCFVPTIESFDTVSDVAVSRSGAARGGIECLTPVPDVCRSDTPGKGFNRAVPNLDAGRSDASTKESDESAPNLGIRQSSSHRRRFGLKSYCFVPTIESYDTVSDVVAGRSGTTAKDTKQFNPTLGACRSGASKSKDDQKSSGSEYSPNVKLRRPRTIDDWAKIRLPTHRVRPYQPRKPKAKLARYVLITQAAEPQTPRSVDSCQVPDQASVTLQTKMH